MSSGTTRESKTSHNVSTQSAIDAAPDPLAIVRQVAVQDGSKPAMIHWRAPTDPAPLTYTYAACHDAAAQLAGALRARGVTAGDTVAILAPSIPETMIALIAVASVAVAFPMNLLLSAEAIAAQLALAEAKAVITFGSHPAFDLNARVADAVRATASVRFVVEIEAGQGAPSTSMRPGHVPWSRFLAEADAVAEAIGPTDRTAALFHTGGTTGAPKLAELSLGGVTAAAHMSAAGINFQSSDRLLQLLPYFHVGGAIAAGLSVFCAGGTLITCGLAGGRNPDLIKAIWATADAMDATLVGMVPSTWGLVATLPGPTRWPALRGLITGATAMTPDLVERLEALVGLPMTQVFGMSELSGIVSAQPVDGAFRAPAVGYPVPLLDIRLDPIAPGGPNEVMIRGPNLFKGYRTLDGLADPPTRGWVASGDLGEIGTDGQLRLTGRRKDVIVRSGHNIDPLSIEDVACRHPDVLAAAAVGMPDDYAGELPIVYVIRRPGSELSEEALAAFLAEHVAEPPSRPRRIYFVTELPMTPVGKIARYRLRQAAAALRASEELAGLTPRHVDCTDYAARLVTIDWPSEATAEHRADAETRLGRLGLRADHRGSASPATKV